MWCVQAEEGRILPASVQERNSDTCACLYIYIHTSLVHISVVYIYICACMYLSRFFSLN